MLERKKNDINALCQLQGDVTIEYLPRYLRLPKNGTREATEHMITRIDGKIARLATLGLRPHPTMLGYRQELSEQLDNGGPYLLRVTSGVF